MQAAAARPAPHLCLSIATQVIPTGRQAGRSPKVVGAVLTYRGAARKRAASRMTVTLAMGIGSWVGPTQRRNGVARMLGEVAMCKCQPRPSTAMRRILTGKPLGQTPRKHGAVSMMPVAVKNIQLYLNMQLTC